MPHWETAVPEEHAPYLADAEAIIAALKARQSGEAELEGDAIEIQKPIPLGNLYQPGGTLDTSEDHEAIAFAFGLKIFAAPRVPQGEIWMGVDLSTGPDITAYRDADGKIHIITPGKEPE